MLGQWVGQQLWSMTGQLLLVMCQARTADCRRVLHFCGQFDPTRFFFVRLGHPWALASRKDGKTATTMLATQTRAFPSHHRPISRLFRRGNWGLTGIRGGISVHWAHNWTWEVDLYDFGAAAGRVEGSQCAAGSYLQVVSPRCFSHD